MKRFLALLLGAAMLLSLCACSLASQSPQDSGLTLVLSDDGEQSSTEKAQSTQTPDENEVPLLDEHGSYDSAEDVALFLIQYGRLPDNYISKKEAQALGWSGGSVEQYAPGKCIGGSYFGNYEGKLPSAEGREYHECDIGTLGAKGRGARRLVWSNDGLIYYTEDHYESFTLLYGDN